MNRPLWSPGPFRADQIGDGDYYELSNGHPIECSPSGRDHTGPNVSGAERMGSRLSTNAQAKELPAFHAG